LFSGCNQQAGVAESSLKNTIDSLNRYYDTIPGLGSESLSEVRKLISRSDSLNYPKGAVEAGILAYKIYFRNEQYNEALKILNTTEEKLTKAGDPLLSGRVYFYYGQFHERIANDEVALTYYLKSAESFSRIGDDGRLAKVYRQINNVSLDNQDWPLSQKYAWLAYHTHWKVKDTLEVLKDVMNLSTFYAKYGNSDSAEFFMNQALQINKQLKSPQDQAQMYNNIASRYINSGRYDSAEKLLVHALDILKKLPDDHGLKVVGSYVYVNLGLVNMAKQRYREAKDLFEQSLNKAGYSVDVNTLSGIIFELIKCNNALRNYEEASDLMDRYRILQDSSNRIRNYQNLLALEMKYNYERQVQEHQVKLQRQRIFLISGAMVAGLVLMLLLVLYQKQRIKLQNTKLEKKIQDDKVERLNRELALHALNLVRLNERKVSFIESLKEKFPVLKKENRDIIQHVIAGLADDQHESGWKEFEIRFTEVHHEFYAKLSRINPNLTLNEKRLCAFLLLDMTSKEISSITGQSVRAIEQARTRLRKQLGITNQNASLSAFLSSL
jgi:tetratricopeptide (TPR) repeat protein